MTWKPRGTFAGTEAAEGRSSRDVMHLSSTRSGRLPLEVPSSAVMATSPTEAAVATPEYYARLMAVVARTRKDLYLNVDQKLALQALFARFEEVAESA